MDDAVIFFTKLFIRMPDAKDLVPNLQRICPTSKLREIVASLWRRDVMLCHGTQNHEVVILG